MARITFASIARPTRRKHDYGVPAFNINNMEQALAIMDAASSLDAPVIIQASRGARSYANDVMLKHMMDAIYRNLSADFRSASISITATSRPTCMTAIQAGFTSVMMDGLAQGRRQERRATGTIMSASPGKSPTWPHLGGISVEGRNLACLGFARDRHGRQGGRSRRRGQALPTTSCSPIPDEGRQVSSRRPRSTRWRFAMGTSHGAYKFTRKPDGDILAMNVIEEIHRKLPNMHLVMHGSSSVPQELQDIINANGGKMKPNLGRAGFRDPGAASRTASARSTSIPTNRNGDDRTDPEGAERQSGGIRSAQISQTPRWRRWPKLCKAAAAGIQYRRPGEQDQAGALLRPRWPSATPGASLDPKVA